MHTLSVVNSLTYKMLKKIAFMDQGNIDISYTHSSRGVPFLMGLPAAMVMVVAMEEIVVATEAMVAATEAMVVAMEALHTLSNSVQLLMLIKNVFIVQGDFSYISDSRGSLL